MLALKRHRAIGIQGDEKRLREIIDRAVALNMPTGDDTREGPVRQMHLEGSHLAIAFGAGSNWERCKSLCTVMSVGRELKALTFSVEWPDANSWLAEFGMKEENGECERI